MTIRISMQRDAYVGWNGRETPAREDVREFADHQAAANWLIYDSYFEEGYTRRLVWEVIDAVHATAPPPSGVAGAPTYATGGYVGPVDGGWLRVTLPASDRAHALPAYARPTVTPTVSNGGPTLPPPMADFGITRTGDVVGVYDAPGEVREEFRPKRTSGPLDPEIHAALVRAVERAREAGQRLSIPQEVTP